ncbi:MAG: vanadium-dependent haloperoxidase [Planctomycetota bacterium]
MMTVVRRLAFSTAIACAGTVPGLAQSRTTDQYPADVATAWMDLLVQSVKTEKYSPVVASRLYGFAGITLYESVCAGMPGHRSLGNQLLDLGTVPKPKRALKYHWPAAANAAVASVLRTLLASASAATLTAIDDLEQSFATEFAAETRARVLARSTAYGQRIADLIVAWAAGDGYATYHNCSYTPPVGPGLWEPTPPDFKPPLEPCWGQIRTFALPASDFCSPPPAPAYSTDPASEFYAAAEEVFTVWQNLTQEQKDIATFWADSPGVTGTPPGHWVRIVSAVCSQYQMQLDVAAECYARVGIAVHDAFINCWQAKYTFNLLRPVTYIQANIQAGWLPYLNNTPAFPTYTSGHSTQSGAVAALLADLLGDLPFTDDTHADLGYPSRSFDSFWEAAEEAAVSRLYGGIHYRFDNDRGNETGRCVGLVILGSVSFTR